MSLSSRWVGGWVVSCACELQAPMGAYSGYYPAHTSCVLTVTTHVHPLLPIQVSDSSARVQCTAIAWHPDVATQMVTASVDDRSPVIQVCVCVCVCARACARVCVRACMRARVCVCDWLLVWTTLGSKGIAGTIFMSTKLSLPQVYKLQCYTGHRSKGYTLACV